MTPWRTWFRRKYLARPRTDATRARLRLELLEDRTVPSTVWYVNASVPGPTSGGAPGAASGSSWSNAFTDLQSALGAAQAGDQIWVAQGTYKPTAGADRTASFALKDGVAVYGSFAGTETQLSQRDLAHHATILSGNIGPAGDTSHNSYHVVTAANLSATTILDGFTITGGNANGTGTNQDRGGGLFADHAAVTLSDLIFTGNSAHTGGAIENHSGAPTLTNALFTGNGADDVPPVPGGPPGSLPGAQGFVGGSGLDNDGGSPTLINVTFSDTSAAEITNTGALTVTDSILWGSLAAEFAGSGSATVNYSDVQGSLAGASGTHNINVDPQFVDAAHGNFHLKLGSPAIDAGTNTGAPSTDLEGQPRPTVGAGTIPISINPDLGAYEFQSVDVLQLAPVASAATNAATIHFHVLFSQPVTDFGPAGAVLSGTAGATTVQVAGSGTTYDLAVSGMTHNGTVIVNIPANVTHNAAGQGNDAWTGAVSEVIYDTTPPVTTATLSGTLGNGGWYTGPVQVTLGATDAGSGPASTSYRIDGGAWHTYLDAPFTVSGDGTHTVSFYSVSVAGNIEATKTTQFKIDATAPVTTASLAGTTGSAGWYTGPVQVTLAATDATSGVASTSYKIDGGAAQTYSGAFTVSGDGTHTVTFFSVDNAGNTEAAQTTSVKIDTTAPVTTATLTGTTGSAGWYKSAVQVTLAATDATSGVASTSYKIDGGAAQTYNSAFTVSGDGTHTVTFFSTDNAGNVEHATTDTVKIDTTPPTTTFQLWGTDGHAGHYSSDVRVVLIPTDATSGVAATYYQVDDGTVTTHHGDFMVRGLGQHHVKFYSVDKAGNAERAQTIWFNIYALPPKLGVNPLAPVNLATNLRLPLAGVTVSGATVAVTVTDVSGHTVAATTTAGAVGQWSIPAVDVHTLTDGTLTIRVTATDAAGAQTTQVRSTTKSSQLVLSFLQEPTNTRVGRVLFAVVQLRDGFGNVLYLPGQAVTMSLVSATPTGPASTGTLRGTVTLHTNAGGWVIFSDLRVTAPGQYRLRAADGTATALSLPFRITA